MKKLLSILSVFSLYFVSAVPAYALDICPQNVPGQQGQFDPLCNFSIDKFGQYIGTIISLILIVAVIIALFFLIIGGVRWILSGGDKTGVEGARNTIIAAVVGLIIIFLSYLILNFVIGFFIPGFSLRNIVLPHL